MIIYKTTNLINDKIYIGQDSKNNPKYLGSGLLINRSIKKYGRDNFIKEIIEHCETKDLLNEREKFWIDELNATDLSIGYNITIGGEGGLTSTPENISNKVKALWENVDYINLQKESRKDRIYRQIGEYNHSNETKEKLRKIHIGKTQSEEHKEKTRIFNKEKRVYTILKCVETNQIFKSIEDAKKWLGSGDIQACVSGKQKTAGGYHWVRLSEVRNRK